MLYVTTAWATTKPSSIESCFRKARFTTDSHEEEMNDVIFDDVLLQFPNYASLDDDVCPNEMRDTEEITQDFWRQKSIQMRNKRNRKRNKISPRGSAYQKISFRSSQELRKFFPSLENSEELLQTLNKLENFLALEVSKRAKQTKIDAHTYICKIPCDVLSDCYNIREKRGVSTNINIY